MKLDVETSSGAEGRKDNNTIVCREEKLSRGGGGSIWSRRSVTKDSNRGALSKLSFEGWVGAF